MFRNISRDIYTGQYLHNFSFASIELSDISCLITDLYEQKDSRQKSYKHSRTERHQNFGIFLVRQTK